MYVVMPIKKPPHPSGGLANAFQRMDHRWRFRQWVDDDPLAPQQWGKTSMKRHGYSPSNFSLPQIK
jgi:hypothetical protein